MIKLNGIDVKITNFPDKTYKIDIDEENIELFISNKSIIEWKFENQGELIILMFLKKHLDEHHVKEVDLIMPYIPNARFDRVQQDTEIFTLKYFAHIINDLNFSNVYVLDAHSNVSLALIDNLRNINVKNYIEKAINDIIESGVKKDNLVLFMPDEGAHKRYASLFKDISSTFGIKHRDWKTGDILSYEVAERDLVKDKTILIIDDICSAGGTFYFAGITLKQAGAKDVNLYISHCEETIKSGKLNTEETPIHQIYSANVLFDYNNPYNAKLKQLVKLIDI